MRRLRRAVHDSATVLRVLASVARVGVLLQRGGFPLTATHLGLEPAGDRDLAPAPAGRGRDVRIAARAVQVLGDRVTCLHKALALSQVLTADGVPCAVVVGVRGDAGFAAHAWVETARGRIDPNRRQDLAAWSEVGRFAVPAAS